MHFTFWPFKYCETLGQKKVGVAANLLEEKEKNRLARKFDAETSTTDNQESQRTPALHGAGNRDTIQLTLIQDEELD